MENVVVIEEAIIEEDEMNTEDIIIETKIEPMNYPTSSNKKSNKNNQAGKRKRNPEEWKKTKAKRNRSMGLEYVNTSGKTIPARKFNDLVCNCNNKCNTKITAEARENVFRQFYELGNQTLQNLYLRGQVQIQEIKRHRPKDKTRPQKTQSFYYFIRVGKSNIKVCKKYFRDTFQVGNSRLHRSCSVDNITDLVDKRGRKQASNKVDTTDAEDHILSFPTYTDPSAKGAEAKRKYLDCSLTLQEMYESYVAHSNAKQKKPVKKSMYYHVMRSKFQIYFPKPVKSEPVTIVKKEPAQPKIVVQSQPSPIIASGKKFIKISKDGSFIQPSSSSNNTQTIILNAVESPENTKIQTVLNPGTIVYTNANNFLQNLNGNTKPTIIQVAALPANMYQTISYTPNQNHNDVVFFS